MRSILHMKKQRSLKQTLFVALTILFIVGVFLKLKISADHKLHPTPQVLPNHRTEVLKFLKKNKISEADEIPLVGIGKTSFQSTSSTSRKSSQLYESVRPNLVKIARWGYLSSSELVELKKELLKISDEIPILISSELKKVNKDRIDTEADAKRTIENVDLLFFLAKNGSPEALDQIRQLASRSVKFEKDRQVNDGVQAQITLESFQSWSALEPEQAKTFLEKIVTQPWIREIYLKHFEIGRQL